MRSAYGRVIPGEDEELTHVGPGTPMGELLRRHWQPVGVSEELTELPKRIRILGEDLVLFRDRKGRPGLLDLHCSHRGTSLEWGRVEDEGIRCCYHGWLYNVQGHCVEMPCEPPGYAQRRKIEHPAYPVMEFGGLVFAYMGPPDRQPLFPMYDIYDLRHRQDVVLRGMRIWGDCSIGYVRDCNWLQHLENVLDPWHLLILHTMISGAQFSGVLGLSQRPEIEFEETSLGARYHVERDLPNGNRLTRYVEVVAPNIYLVSNIHERGDRLIENDRPSEFSGAVPIDDTHVSGLSIVAWPLVDGQPDPSFRPRTDTVTYDERGNKIRPGDQRNRSYEERQRQPDDMEAQEGQRPIAIHALENLVSSDKGVSLLRRKLGQSLSLMREGKDPLNIVRDPEKNRAIETHAYNTVRPIPAAGKRELASRPA